MKKTLPYLLLICICVGCRVQRSNEETSFEETPKMIHDQKDVSKYTLHKNDTLELMFVTNSSTGYHWRWLNQKECSVVDSIDMHYHQDHPELIGSSAKMYWQFCAHKVGTNTLHFGYSPVYNSSIIVKERSVTITVTE